STLRVQPPLPAPWSTGLFDCCDDVGNCKPSYCHRCCITRTLRDLLLPMYHLRSDCGDRRRRIRRSKMRGQLFLEESPCADCAVHCCCESCALCQEYRELKIRGFNLHYGWLHGNLKVQNVTLPPSVEGGMQR
ncbi:hypothetical protein GW17_00059249, partial [Ensete ventricosum]